MQLAKTFLITYLLIYLMAIATGLMDFGLAKINLPGTSAICAHTPVSHTNRWQGFINLLQPLDINKLYNVYVVEDLIHFTIESDAEINGSSLWTEDLTKEFSLKYSQGISA